jgi:PAS domain S-box-containing protein
MRLDKSDQPEPSRGVSSRQFLRLAEDLLDIGFWWSDLTGRRVEASVGLYRVLGVEPFTDISNGWGLRLVHPDDLDSVTSTLALLRDGQAIRHDFRIIRPDRTLRWVAQQAELLFGSDGRPQQAVGLLRDITPQIETQRSLQQKHDRLAALINATADVFWIVSADGGVIDMPQWEKLTGQTRNDYQDDGWLARLHPDDRARTDHAWRAALTNKSLYNTDYRVQCADGIYRWFNSRGAAVRNPDGSVREWVGACFAIPDRGQIARATTSRDGMAPVTRERLITPQQLRAARAILNLTVQDLAKTAGVSASTIRRSEEAVRPVETRPGTLRTLRATLESAGVVFDFPPDQCPGVRPARA